MMGIIVLEPLPTEIQGDDCVRSCLIKRVDDDSQTSEQTLWFKFPRSIVPPKENDCDSYLLAVISDAMAEGRDVVVKGSVSLGLLANLIEFQSAWRRWLPEIYSIVDIKVDSVRENERPVPGALCAFSGGVDATFSVWRHSQKRNSFRSQKINLCGLVHGFDIPLADTEAFESVVRRSRQTLDDIGVELVPIKTNFREISPVNWEHSHAAALVAAFSNLKSVAGTNVIGSSGDYRSFTIPWGSSPITDHLLSSEDFIVMHDGASHTRTEKVKEISDWKVGVGNLRVCWAGETKDENCGECEKCVRTKLNFLALGLPLPGCFKKEGKVEDNFKNIILTTRGARTQWLQLAEYAKENHVNDRWVEEAKKVINRKPKFDFLLPEGSQRRLFIKKLVHKLGLKR